MWQILRRNPQAFGAALLLHLILAVFILVDVDWLVSFDEVRGEPRVIRTTTIISAEAIAAKAAAERKAKEAAQRQIEAERKAEEEARRQAELKRKAEEEARQRAAAERKAKEAAQRQIEAERKAEEEARRQAELKRKAEEEARQRAAAERKAKEAAQRQIEAERKAEEEARRQAEALQAREAELLAALDAEQAAAGELSLYTNKIRARIRRNWVRQPGMGRDLSCLVEVRLIPGGEVVPAGVRVIHSSGHPAFDRSVVTAVYKASPLPVPSGLLFGQFRNLRLDFKP